MQPTQLENSSQGTLHRRSFTLIPKFQMGNLVGSWTIYAKSGNGLHNLESRFVHAARFLLSASIVSNNSVLSLKIGTLK